MVKQYMSRIPSCIMGGSGSLTQLGVVLTGEGIQCALVFTDAGVRDAGLLAPVLEQLEQAGTAYTVFDQLKAEPSYLDVDTLMHRVAGAEGELIVAVGGGSVMDAAKLCAVLIRAPYTVKDLLKNPVLARKQLPCIMIPTTCGTGSEATCNAIVAVPEDNVKVGIVSDAMIPDRVILDPELIRRLPKSIVAATGVDALAHAVECYTSLKANPLSDVYAMASARLIMRSIRRAWAEPDDMQAKTDMLVGAFYGGAAITASGTTAVHALSYPLGGKFHIPHGVSNAILFAHVMRVNMHDCEGRLAELCDAVYPEQHGCSTAQRAAYMVEQIADIVRFCEIPTHLGTFGVTEADLDFLVEAGSGVRRLLDNNPRELTLDEIRSIYRKVL